MTNIHLSQEDQYISSLTRQHRLVKAGVHQAKSYLIWRLYVTNPRIQIQEHIVYVHCWEEECIVYIHCREEGWIGLYIPSDLKISLGPWDVPRALPSGHISGLGKSLGCRGCTTQYIPPLGSVCIQYLFCFCFIFVFVFYICVCFVFVSCMYVQIIWQIEGGAWWSWYISIIV